MNMRTVGELLIAPLNTNNKRKLIREYGSAVGNATCRIECKKLDIALMNIDSHSATYPTEIDGEQANSPKEICELLAKRYL